MRRKSSWHLLEETGKKILAATTQILLFFWGKHLLLSARVMEGDNKNDCPSLTWSQCLREVASKVPVFLTFISREDGARMPHVLGAGRLWEVELVRPGLGHQVPGCYIKGEEDSPHHLLATGRVSQASWLAQTPHLSLRHLPPSSTIN